MFGNAYFPKKMNNYSFNNLKPTEVNSTLFMNGTPTLIFNKHPELKALI
jgi:hypothetical protein